MSSWHMTILLPMNTTIDRVVAQTPECHCARVLFIHKFQWISHAEWQVSGISHMPTVVAEEHEVHPNLRYWMMLSQTSMHCGCMRLIYPWMILVPVVLHASEQPAWSPPSLYPLVGHGNKHEEYGGGMTVVTISLMLRIEWPIGYQPLQKRDWHCMHLQSCMNLCKMDIPPVKTIWTLQHWSGNRRWALDGGKCIIECPICHLQEKSQI